MNGKKKKDLEESLAKEYILDVGYVVYFLAKF